MNRLCPVCGTPQHDKALVILEQLKSSLLITKKVAEKTNLAGFPHFTLSSGIDIAIRQIEYFV